MFILLDIFEHENINYETNDNFLLESSEKLALVIDKC